MKWPWKKKEVKQEPIRCCHCGNAMSRQTTLLEFGLEFELPKGQQTLDIEFETTEQVGMDSSKRKYRGSL